MLEHDPFNRIDFQGLYKKISEKGVIADAYDMTPSYIDDMIGGNSPDF
jgi:hypothetical protein